MPGYPYQLTYFLVEILKLLSIPFSVIPLILFQGLKLLCLPHGPLNTLFGFLGPMSVHIAYHRLDKFILYGFEGGADIVLIMLHSSAPLPLQACLLLTNTLPYLHTH